MQNVVCWISYSRSFDCATYVGGAVLGDFARRNVASINDPIVSVCPKECIYFLLILAVVHSCSVRALGVYLYFARYGCARYGGMLGDRWRCHGVHCSQRWPGLNLHDDWVCTRHMYTTTNIYNHTQTHRKTLGSTLDRWSWRISEIIKYVNDHN